VAAWLLRRLSFADAEDVLQDILLKAWRAAATYQGGNYRAWLFQIARTSLADWTRRKRPPMADLKDGPDPIDSDGFGMSDRAVDLEQCLTQLDERERDLLRARFGGVEDLPAACIRFGITKKTAQNLISLALGKLRECIDRRSQA
jgi:RNA polymerase sigma-70 factor (ECF subfamily)